MKEIILNIYLVINDNFVTEFRALKYEISGSDEEKIQFLKTRALSDFDLAVVFDAPTDKLGNKMSYKKFHKLERQGFQYQLFENIFQFFNVPENPLVCVTPVLEGKILAEKFQ